MTNSTTSLKRALRSLWLGAFLVMSGVRDPGIWSAAAQPSSTANSANLEAFLQELWPEAERKGVTRSTFDQAFAGVTPDPRVIALTRNQPDTANRLEHTSKPWLPRHASTRGSAKPHSNPPSSTRSSRDSASTVGSSWPFGASRRHSASNRSAGTSSDHCRHSRRPIIVIPFSAMNSPRR